MPNRYSHAFVLSRYEAKGFIDLPYPSPSPPSTSQPSLDYRLSTRSSGAATTPSINAVPGLSSDSSTTSTSTVSSLDEVPSRLLQSASSSIVTEIYAPQEPSFEPEAIDPTTEEQPVQQEEPSLLSPPSKQPPAEQSPPRTTSRYSFIHSFSALLNPPQRPKRHQQRSQSHHPEPIAGTPRRATPNPPTPRYQPSPHQPPTRPSFSSSRPRTPYKRIHPVFSNDSIASLSLADIRGPESHLPPSPNENVLPWEYPASQPSRLEVYQPRGYPEQEHSQGAACATIIPTRRSSISQRYHDAFYASQAPNTGDDDSIFEPIFANTSTPQNPEHPLSRSSSFDSAAPPPIRKGPRASLTLQGRKWLGGGGR
ncbi:MAG: hypothetical protein L6R39_005894 [Caloplaca ligustica]|nr:MAG: hypothetical protein L6R39_005894 [Caloplaca ligustica]